MHMRRLVVLLMAVALIVAACSSDGEGSDTTQGGSEPEEREPVELHVLNWEPGSAEYWEETHARFMEKYPWITIEHESVPFQRYLEKQGAYISSGSGPDVMANNVGFELFERSGAYLPINDRIQEVGELDNLLRWQGGCVGFDPNNDCFGIPHSFQGNVMYYNRTILTDAGLDPDNPPVTWEEFGEACDAIEAIGKACIAMGTGINIGFWNFPEIARNFLSEEDMLAVFRGDLPWTDPKMVTVLEYLKDMVDRGWFQDGAANIVMLPDGADIFVSEEAAFTGTIISGVMHWSAFGSELGHENLGVMNWPIIDESAELASSFSGVEGHIHGITKWSEHPEEAFLYLDWLATEENANLWLELAEGQPINDQFDRSIVTYSPAFDTIQEIISQPTLHVGVMLSGREMDALSRGYQQIMAGTITLEEWVASMQDALEQSELKQG